MYGLDSVGFLELRVQCEDRFGITISDDDFNADNFATLGGVVALVDRLLAASGQQATTHGGRS
jgi:acyl carrier protein